MNAATTRDRALDVLAEAIADELWSRVLEEAARDRYGVKSQEAETLKQTVAS
jgi:hypothetical protein